jgi:hypothetical protein
MPAGTENLSGQDHLLEPPDEEPAAEQDHEADPLNGGLSSNSTIKVSDVVAGTTYLKLPLV